jgi:hypothetical protein
MVSNFVGVRKVDGDPEVDVEHAVRVSDEWIGVYSSGGSFLGAVRLPEYTVCGEVTAGMKPVSWNDPPWQRGCMHCAMAGGARGGAG